ncbi:MAG: ATP synthase F1 subunit gamma [Proteobacteria bacterium]|nr:ATP synthase F1 subunit gamma [Pseudomonadota bacterium]MCP4918659.1 ATP synthase F1 subunit gamma [Pseudomonadota bacterium]
MPANLRDIKRRIGSVKNTRQITKAMKMVSASKLKRAQERATAARPYADATDRVLARVLASAGDDVEHPLLTSHDEVKNVLIVWVSSDKGLCGGFNSQLFRAGKTWIPENTAGKTVSYRPYGKKAVAHLKGENITAKEIDLAGRIPELAQDLANHLTADFESGEVHEVYLAYSAWQSVMIQNPTFKKVLPMVVETGDAESSDDVEYDYEPGGQQLLDTLLPLQLQTVLMQAFLESEAGEQASRMTAMDAATRNASDLIDSLTLEYNRARQAAITTEIIEIVSGAEAL